MVNAPYGICIPNRSAEVEAAIALASDTYRKRFPTQRHRIIYRYKGQHEQTPFDY
ncbi:MULTISPECIES: hypothetical protein [unclassified Coleofasciculus]|uniref:hypothetical protein n=1 Tax=Cyanophyceae TaxID=3028117 RepID=UPI00168453C9|nr:MULTISPECIES: hypothetical protein [unclassified Coleofasciculus]MBD1889895.1 hypothetical protein [Coleofasciculus sp. FACHB-SPT9]MBD1895546.1 hypothetical protein [Coleofasciculus sp. FACHB-129]